MNDNKRETASFQERRKILVVATRQFFSPDSMDYSIHLAERLDYDLLAMNVCPEGSGKTGSRKSKKFVQQFRRKASRRGIGFSHAVKFGDLGAAVEELNHEVKRIEFVVADSGVYTEAVAREVTIPMFSVVSNSFKEKGGKDMATEQILTKKKPVGQTIGYGLLTVVMYAAVFLNADSVMTYFTKGGWYGALPVATVFLFSFAHGAFASNLWSLLGIEAMKKDALRQTEKKVVEKRKKAAKKPRAYAYVNPFHRL